MASRTPKLPTGKSKLEDSILVTLRMPNELNIALRQIANARGEKYQSMIKKALQEYVNCELSSIIAQAKECNSSQS